MEKVNWLSVTGAIVDIAAEDPSYVYHLRGEVDIGSSNLYFGLGTDASDLEWVDTETTIFEVELAGGFYPPSYGISLSGIPNENNLPTIAWVYLEPFWENDTGTYVTVHLVEGNKKVKIADISVPALAPNEGGYNAIPILLDGIVEIGSGGGVQPMQTGNRLVRDYPDIVRVTPKNYAWLKPPPAPVVPPSKPAKSSASQPRRSSSSVSYGRDGIIEGMGNFIPYEIPDFDPGIWDSKNEYRTWVKAIEANGGVPDLDPEYGFGIGNVIKRDDGSIVLVMPPIHALG